MLDNSDQIHALLAEGMGQTLHWFPEEVSISILATTLVGMANAIGGLVLLGVSPRVGELVGVKNYQAACDRVFQSALLVEPTLVLPIPRLVKVKNTITGNSVDLVLVTVPDGLPYVYCLEGRYLGREGSQNNPLSARQLYQLLAQRSSVQFESRLVPDASLEDLDQEQVMEYAGISGNIATDDLENGHEFLLRRGCLKQVDDMLKLTNAAVLLFGRFPQQWLPNATILAGRFPGRALTGEYIKKEITGSLPQQLQQAEAFIRTNLRTTVRLVGLQHQETLEYPFEAVRELLVNAIAHRDYNLQGDNIHLNIFSDRLEITSPGSLPGPVTIKNLLEARFARNAVISQVLSDLGYVERLGYGLDRVVEVTRAAGLLPPQFEETSGTFRVTLYASQVGGCEGGSFPDLSAYASLDLNPRQQLALAQVSLHARISSHDYQALCPDVHSETLRRDLADLVTRGILIKVGDKKSTYYILKRI
ncbi:MAG: transcriptional regulator [Anaerolineales bacterium]|nr:transcriptional regulator [Anaerolineae bacterium]PWB54918.1 MAG: transcriptional regulator [Anaerolineales bacterium]